MCLDQVFKSPHDREFWRIVKSRGAASQEMKKYLGRIQSSPEFGRLKGYADEIIGTPLELDEQATPRADSP